jgi:hypothetical protein
MNVDILGLDALVFTGDPERVYQVARIFGAQMLDCMRVIWGRSGKVLRNCRNGW